MDKNTKNLTTETSGRYAWGSDDNKVSLDGESAFNYIFNVILDDNVYQAPSLFADMVCNGAIPISLLDDALAFTRVSKISGCPNNTQRTDLLICFVSCVRAYALCWKELCKWTDNRNKANNPIALNIAQQMETQMLQKLLNYWKMVTFYMYRLEQNDAGVVIV